jgi:hypothetical protein
MRILEEKEEERFKGRQESGAERGVGAQRYRAPIRAYVLSVVALMLHVCM